MTTEDLERKDPGCVVYPFGARVSIENPGRSSVAAFCQVTTAMVILWNELDEVEWRQSLADFKEAHYKGAMPGGGEDEVEMLPGPVGGLKRNPEPFGGTELYPLLRLDQGRGAQASSGLSLLFFRHLFQDPRLQSRVDQLLP